MKIVLLGGNGFVGRNIQETLEKEKIIAVPVSRKSGYDLRELSQNLQFIEENNPDIIINCAAHVGSLNYVTESAGDILIDNSKMILHLYEAVKTINSKIIIIQPIANCAYPGDAVIYKEDEFWNGPLHSSVMAYGFTRRMMWTAADAFRNQYGIRSINLLTPNMYGPYDSTDPNKAHALNALISKFIKAIHEHQAQVEIWGSGVAIREWLYAPDFARAVLEVLQNIDDKKYDQPVNIAQEYGLSVKELVDLILKNVSYKGKPWYNTVKPDGAPRKVMDKTRFVKIFPGFEFTSFEKGIKRTAEYYDSVYPY